MAEEKEVKETKEKLEGLLGSMDKEKPSGSAFSFLGGGPSGKAAPKAAAGRRGADHELAERLRVMEEQLAQEKEKALRAEILLKEKENVRLEMETLFRTMKDQLMKEKMSQEMDSDRQNARARVETLEKRLDEVGRLLVQALQNRRDPDQDALSSEVLKEILARQSEFTAMLAKKEDEISGLKARLDDADAKASERFQKAVDELRLELVAKNKELAELAALKETFAQLKEAHESLQRLVGPEGAPLRDLVKALRSEIEALKRDNASLKSALQDAEVRHEQLRTENRSLLRKLGDKEAALAAKRLEDIPEEMKRLEKAVGDALESARAGEPPSLEPFRQALEEKEKELERIREGLRKPPDSVK